MENLIQQLIRGQEKLEWAVEKQMTSAQADRELMRDSLANHADHMQKVADDRREFTTQLQIRAGTGPNISLQKYAPGEDPDAFLLNFDRAARASGWPEAKWPFFLAPLHTGEAQAAYQVANPNSNTSYTEIKDLILDHMGLDAEAYRVRFRKERGTASDNPKTLYFKLKAAADKWLGPRSQTKDEIMDMSYLEQFLEALPYPIQRWLKQHKHLSPEQAVEMATTFYRAQPRVLTWDSDKSTKPVSGPVKPEKKPLKPSLDVVRPKTPRLEPPPLRNPQCFECGEWGHIARNCPRKKPPEEPMDIGCIPRAILYSAELGPSFHVSVHVKGVQVRALLDSGCKQSIILQSIVVPLPEEVEDSVPIRCVHGDVKVYPVIKLPVTLPHGQTIEIRLGVVPSLPEQMIIGQDNPSFLNMLRNKLQNNPSTTKTRPTLLTQAPWVSDRSFRYAQKNDPTLQSAWTQAQQTSNSYPSFQIKHELLYRIGK
ncbi:uncharacterized protein LOC144791552 [Lissotriton helveticus]